VDAQSEPFIADVAGAAAPDLESVFVAHYGRIARVLARVTRDRARAEELAVEAFLKWAHHPAAHGEGAVGWLLRTAVRLGLDELRREARRQRYARLVAPLRREPPTPEHVRTTDEAQLRVRAVLASLKCRDAELLVLRTEGLSYAELGAALHLNPASVGTLLGRAQRTFRDIYVRRYGHP
jgi:RNA polymerase sigma-70 factor (ECF subfamily)